MMDINCVHWWCNLFMISQVASSDTTFQRQILLPCLSFLMPMFRSHRVLTWKNNAFITRILVAKVRFLSFQIFDSVEADVLAMASCLLISTELPPSHFVTQLMHDLYTLLSTFFKLRWDFSIPGSFPGLRWFIASFAPFCKVSGSSMGSSSTLTPSWVSTSSVSLQYTVLHNITSSTLLLYLHPLLKCSHFYPSRHISLGVGFLVSDLMCLNISLVLLTSLSFSLLVTTNYSWSTPYMRESAGWLGIQK